MPENDIVTSDKKIEESVQMGATVLYDNGTILEELALPPSMEFVTVMLLMKSSVSFPTYRCDTEKVVGVVIVTDGIPKTFSLASEISLDSKENLSAMPSVYMDTEASESA